MACFAPDAPGEYKITLSGHLVLADTVKATYARDSEYVMTIEAERVALAERGCSAAPGPTARLPIAAGGLALLVVLAWSACQVTRPRDPRGPAT